jgi:hypothetical protein
MCLPLSFNLVYPSIKQSLAYRGCILPRAVSRKYPIQILSSARSSFQSEAERFWI